MKAQQFVRVHHDMGRRIQHARNESPPVLSDIYICDEILSDSCCSAGVIQMNLGILMSLYNQRYFRDSLSTWCVCCTECCHPELSRLHGPIWFTYPRQLFPTSYVHITNLVTLLSTALACFVDLSTRVSKPMIQRHWLLHIDSLTLSALFDVPQV